MDKFRLRYTLRALFSVLNGEKFGPLWIDSILLQYQGMTSCIVAIFLLYCPNNIFKTGMCIEACKELSNVDPAAFSSTRSRCAVYASRRKRAEAGDMSQPTRVRVPRSRSSPQRIPDLGQSPQRTRSPSNAELPVTSISTAPAMISPLLYNCSSNVLGAVAFFSPHPPSMPMYLVPLPPNPEILNKTKTCNTKTQGKKSISKSSKRVVRFVMQTVLRGVYETVTTVPPSEEHTVVSTANPGEIPPAKACPAFHNVASQTKPKIPFNRPSTAATVTDDLSISSEECCVDCDATCEWAGNVRALRESHVRLVLRQLQQLRDIERLNRTLHRAHESAHARAPNLPHPASCVPQSACL